MKHDNNIYNYNPLTPGILAGRQNAPEEYKEMLRQASLAGVLSKYV